MTESKSSNFIETKLANLKSLESAIDLHLQNIEKNKLEKSQIITEIKIISNSEIFKQMKILEQALKSNTRATTNITKNVKEIQQEYDIKKANLTNILKIKDILNTEGYWDLMTTSQQQILIKNSYYKVTTNSTVFLNNFRNSVLATYNKFNFNNVVSTYKLDIYTSNHIIFANPRRFFEADILDGPLFKKLYDSELTKLKSLNSYLLTHNMDKLLQSEKDSIEFVENETLVSYLHKQMQIKTDTINFLKSNDLWDQCTDYDKTYIFINPKTIINNVNIIPENVFPTHLEKKIIEIQNTTVTNARITELKITDEMKDFWYNLPNRTKLKITDIQMTTMLTSDIQTLSNQLVDTYLKLMDGFIKIESLLNLINKNSEKIVTKFVDDDMTSKSITYLRSEISTYSSEITAIINIMNKIIDDTLCTNLGYFQALVNDKITTSYIGMYLQLQKISNYINFDKFIAYKDINIILNIMSSLSDIMKNTFTFACTNNITFEIIIKSKFSLNFINGLETYIQLYKKYPYMMNNKSDIDIIYGMNIEYYLKMNYFRLLKRNCSASTDIALSLSTDIYSDISNIIATYNDQISIIYDHSNKHLHDFLTGITDTLFENPAIKAINTVFYDSYKK
jgi:hypothetical protein